MSKKSLNQEAAKTIAESTTDRGKAPGTPDDQPFYKLVKDQHGNLRDVTILQAGFVALLRRLGFRKYDVGEGFIIIRIVDNIIEQFHPHQLRGFIIRHFHHMPDDDLECPKPMLIEKLHRSLGTLTTDEKLSLLFDLDGKEEIVFVQDTIDKAYFFYQNGFVSVTRDSVTLHPYTQLPGAVWKDQVLKRDFTPMKMKEWEKGMYYAFANNVSGNIIDADGKESNPERLVSFMTITGYCLHKFFNTGLKMPIFLDARVSEFAEGRSGKSLHCKAMQAMLNADPDNSRQCIITDGKTFDPENRFKYEDLHIATRLYVIDDAKKGFPIDLFYNTVLDGFMRERKGEKEKVRIRCKPIITLNYTLAVNGGSSRDRVVELEFADFYSADRKPEQVHGCWFFRDWDAEEWARFDNFMLACVCDYLKSGIIMPATINLELRKLIDQTDSEQEFIHFMEDINVVHEKLYSKQELFKQFAQTTDEGKVTRSGFQWLKQKQFTAWLRLWAQYRPEFAGYRETRSNGQDYIAFFYNAPVQPESLEQQAKSTVIRLFAGKSGNVKPIVTEAAPELPDEPPY